MEGITDIIKQELVSLLPLSIIEDVSCFVFYDNHPADERRIDITICTKNGELKEFYQRDMMLSIHLTVSSAPTEIIIQRNSNSELFYIVGGKDEVQIVSYKESLLQFHTSISNVDSYSVDDWDCSGQTYLKVIRKDDAVPIVFDENFKSSEVMYPGKLRRDFLPLLSTLKRKYIEAQHNVRQHEKIIEEYIKLRHASTLCDFLNVQPSNVALFKSALDISLYGVLNVKIGEPWVKVCNKKVFVAIRVWNEYNVPVDQLHMIFTSPILTTMTHTTKIYRKLNILPFWIEQTASLECNCEVTVVAVMKLDDIQPNVTDRIVLKGALSYKIRAHRSNYVLLPFEEVTIPSLETFGDAFDALSSTEYDADTMLALLCTTEKTNLRARIIKSDGQKLIEVLTKHLQMERVGLDVVLYKKSPYHALNGILLHFTGGTVKSVYITAYTRTKRQLLALIHSINDTVPAQIIITTPNYFITTNDPELLELCEPLPQLHIPDYLGYADTVVKRTTKILKYLDFSIIRMNCSANPLVKSKVGFEIDLFGCTKRGYMEFRMAMMRDDDIGVHCLLKDTRCKPEPMCVD